MAWPSPVCLNPSRSNGLGRKTPQNTHQAGSQTKLFCMPVSVAVWPGLPTSPKSTDGYHGLIGEIF